MPQVVLSALEGASECASGFRTFLVVRRRLGAVQPGAPVRKHGLVVQVVGVVGRQPVAHAALLVEQPLVVHRLAGARDLGLCIWCKTWVDSSTKQKAQSLGCEASAVAQ